LVNIWKTNGPNGIPKINLKLFRQRYKLKIYLIKPKRVEKQMSVDGTQ